MQINRANKIKALLVLAAVFVLQGCNNKQEGEISSDDDEDIRIEAHEKQTASDDSYPENDLGEYLKYISHESTAFNNSYPTYKKSVKLLAEAIKEQREEMQLNTSGELQKLADLNLDSEGVDKNKQNLQVLIQNMEELSRESTSNRSSDIENLKDRLEGLDLGDDDEREMNDDVLGFFRKSGEILSSWDSDLTPQTEENTQNNDTVQ